MRPTKVDEGGFLNFADALAYQQLDFASIQEEFMKTVNHPSQRRLFDPFAGVIGSLGRKMIENGWQSLFREVLLEQMPVEKISSDMSDGAGRPSQELYAITGLLLIRDFKGWTVPETHHALLFHTDIQYALNLEPGAQTTQRTIERYLARLQKDESIREEIFASVTDTLLRTMEVKVKKQRLDSTHVLSDMSNIGRARMIGLAIKRFFAKVEKHDALLLDRFPEELLKRYCKPSDGQVFGGLGSTEKRQIALQQAAEDLHTVLSELAEVQPVCGWACFEQLQLIFSQQCELREEFIEVRKKTGGNVLQNTSDPDATYCGNKGPGYQVQICETFNQEGNPNFITSAQVETAVQSDADAVAPILEDLKERDLVPDELLADTGYGSNENVELAKEAGVELVAPVPGGKKFDAAEVGYDQFQLNAANEVEACPAGHAPKSTLYNTQTEQVWAQMDAAICHQCPLLEHCKVQRNKETNQVNGRVQFRRDAPTAAQRRRHEQTDEFRDKYRWRAGIEGTNSSLKRRLGLKRLRVRGWKAVKASILLKLTGWNLLRAVAMRARGMKNAQPELSVA
jgi:hypothetical protein